MHKPPAQSREYEVAPPYKKARADQTANAHLDHNHSTIWPLCMAHLVVIVRLQSTAPDRFRRCQ
ncbi:conserved protein of unknown function [Pseudomonas marincola]|uniref:Uncharacterized protein n=1 Tax=Pseudomonas marincola TaxID=437900 RepID=A0A653E335_9PSED|nr:conserved protein of unknown function [Pseudomonas marincola]